MFEANRIPLLSTTVSCFNIYELDKKLLKKRVRHGIHEFKHGEIRDQPNEELDGLHDKFLFHNSI